MATMTGNSEVNRFSVRTWLFNPFHYVAGLPSLAIGAVVVLLTGWIGSFSRSHFDGILDFHTGLSAPMWFFLVVGVIDALCMGLVLFAAGKIISRSRIRFEDVLGTQFLARWPAVITALIALFPGYQEQMLKFAAMNFTFTPAGVTALSVVFPVMLMMIVWMVVLMYRAFAVSCNARGGKAVASFVIGLVLAEALSKVVVYYMLFRNQPF